MEKVLEVLTQPWCVELVKAIFYITAGGLLTACIIGMRQGREEQQDDEEWMDVANEALVTAQEAKKMVQKMMEGKNYD